ncbi:MAG: hypothetical protein LBN04_02850 [Oscillospiraceae bacterium]|jgi:dienelactone hydrolase|nr:hypothetical protein [Oscillospiraceae bacterium]
MIQTEERTHSLELYPTDNKNRIVLIMSGSDGGIHWARQIAKRFAKCGIASCAMAYWKYKALPKQLSLIPVEAVESAIKYLKALGYQKVALYGVSKGAELALLSASLFSDVGAVVAVSPPCAAFEGLSMRGYTEHSAWTYQSAEVPFIPTGVGKFNTIAMYVKDGGYAFLKNFTAAFAHGFSEENCIKVENARCPILLLSAEDDSIWPATKMSNIIIAKLDAVGYQYPYRHISFAKASHVLCPVQSIARKVFPQERKYPKECEQARQAAFDAAIAWIQGM